LKRKNIPNFADAFINFKADDAPDIIKNEFNSPFENLKPHAQKPEEIKPDFMV